MCKVTIDGEQVEMLVDSSTSVDLIDEKTFRELYKDKKKAPEKNKAQNFLPQISNTITSDGNYPGRTICERQQHPNNLAYR